MKKEVLTDLNGQLVIMGAHRYALGRRTYIVGSIIEWLKENWKYVNEHSRFVILRDTARELMIGDAGDDMDIKCWTEFLKWGMRDIPELERDVRCAVSYIGKPFPLDT